MPSLNYNAINIHYSIAGEGKPLILLHGFGEDGSVWADQIQFFSGYCKVIVPDIPGSGKSDFLPTAKTMDDYADVVKALADELELEKFILIGHSMGGYITLAFAEKYADRLLAWGWVHSTAFADSEEKITTRKKGIEFIENNGAFSFIKTTTPNLYAAKTKEQKPHLIEFQIEKGKVFTNEALIQYYEAMIARPDRTHVLKSSEIPVFFLLGTEDNPAPMSDVLKQVHLPLTSYIHVIENTGHMSMTEAPELVNEKLLQFILEV